MVNIFDFALISIMILIILIVLISFFIAIPIFTIKMYRRMSKEMSSAKKVGFGCVLTLINVCILPGAYFFIYMEIFK